MKISPKVTELSPKVINNKTIKKSNKMKLNIAVLAGDGIGPEIMKQGVAVMHLSRKLFPKQAGRSVERDDTGAGHVAT